MFSIPVGPKESLTDRLVQHPLYKFSISDRNEKETFVPTDLRGISVHIFPYLADWYDSMITTSARERQGRKNVFHRLCNTDYIG